MFAATEGYPTVSDESALTNDVHESSANHPVVTCLESAASMPIAAHQCPPSAAPGDVRRHCPDELSILRWTYWIGVIPPLIAMTCILFLMGAELSDSLPYGLTSPGVLSLVGPGYLLM